MKDAHPNVKNTIIGSSKLRGQKTLNFYLQRHPPVRCCRGMQSTALQCSGAVRVRVYARST